MSEISNFPKEWPSEWLFNSYCDAFELAIVINEKFSALPDKPGKNLPSKSIRIEYPHIGAASVSIKGVFIYIENGIGGSNGQVKITDRENTNLFFPFFWRMLIRERYVWGGPYREPIDIPKKPEPRLRKGRREHGEFREYILEALTESKESPETFLQHSFRDIVELLPKEKRKEAKSIFMYVLEKKLGKEWADLDNTPNDIEPRLSDLIKSPNTIRHWKKQNE